uniref:Uncharacterized protein n=1 Tax=Anguilla anguilla TaxID=7936 RepID=A0A0E9WW99_ANGAN
MSLERCAVHKSEETGPYKPLCLRLGLKQMNAISVSVSGTLLSCLHFFCWL